MPGERRLISTYLPHGNVVVLSALGLREIWYRNIPSLMSGGVERSEKHGKYLDNIGEGVIPIESGFANLLFVP